MFQTRVICLNTTCFFLKKKKVHLFKEMKTYENKNKNKMQVGDNRRKLLNVTKEIVFFSLLAVSGLKTQTKDLSVTLL